MKDYQKKEIFNDLEKLFFDPSKRPKRTPLYESAIKRNLEGKYSSSEIVYALNTLEKKSSKKRLKKLTKKIKPVGDIHFYYPHMLEIIEPKSDIENKIQKLSELIKTYSNKKITDMIGNHLHELVKNHLKLKKFTIIDEHTNEYKNKKWHTNHNLDIIATSKIKKLTVGIEIKNRLDDIRKEEVKIKLKMCKFFGIKSIFACRFTYHEKYINENGGFYWNFKHQIYPENKTNFVKPLQGRLNLPIICSSKIPRHSSMAFTKWLKNH